MAWHDRHYNRESYDSYGGGAGVRFGTGMGAGSMVMWLMIINVVVFLLDGILFGSRRASAVAPSQWGMFTIEQAVFGVQLWRWFTYQFLHGDFFHILVNMIVLYFFGPLMERWWGSRRFIAFYLLCGTSGAVVFTLLAQVPGLLNVTNQTPLIGASGSVFGILVGCAVLYPHQRVMLLIPPIPMSMRTLALVFLGITALGLIAGGHNAGGDAAHLGGAALGFLLVKMPGILNFADSFGGSMTQFRLKRLQSRAQRDRLAAQRQQDEVDRILQKVKDKGLHSLTSREKRALQEATDRQRRTG